MSAPDRNGRAAWQTWLLSAVFVVVVSVVGWSVNAITHRLDVLEAHGAPPMRERLAATDIELKRMHEQTAQQHEEIMAELARQHQQIDRMQGQIVDLMRACR